ncbi:ATP-binding protein involved in chromosome partitioning [Methanohalophilus levihalophilus]|uniref:Mrp/NBP35 family ATP-binding protein n=1 Tax=Methanohalophilus levihalophilus TaxID=1431282 RepID=UPI001AE8A443|nr:Mrp/NBP35 family ATP-binding protein [Methanohalophilus levihalophilus]MBP2030204.1 ATP-binding protein involved in chromosome partitioning [Methanohalophilus levihalophilus]
MSSNILSSESLKSAKPEEPKIVTNLRGIRSKIMVMSGKGGVGKSTVSANLAAFLARKGKKVGLLDGDIHGPTIPTMFGIEDQRPTVGEKGIEPVKVSENLKVMSIGLLLDNQDSPIVWRGPAKMAAIKQFLEEVDWGVLDYLIIDLPPGTGDEPLSIVQLIGKVDGSVVVTTPQDVALTSVRKSLKFADMLNVPVIGLVENMSGVICPDCGKEIDIFGRGSIEKAAEDFNIKILAALPIEPEISATSDAGKVYVEEMDSKWSKGFDDIVDAVENFTNKK